MRPDGDAYPGDRVPRKKVYKNALVHALRKAGITVAQQHRMVVRYDDVVVGDYTVDLLVENIVLVELKVTKVTDDIHRAQCLTYLKATGLRLCRRLNFGKLRLETKRLVRDFQGRQRTLRVRRALRFHFHGTTCPAASPSTIGRCLNHLKTTGLRLCLPRNSASFASRSSEWPGTSKVLSGLCVFGVLCGSISMGPPAPLPTLPSSGAAPE
ncbi:MAG TPA: GxxExxY protein [Rhodopila sp.]|uniref:GxxExxY protein n=1 Tax=Rhodopila sp. TaxID=2480087 RepID=UPI002CD104E2|nr:GxxExxY protein [Rhodopila sp.]HVY15805.1 GxxExxY protein [Rhodopila sp.]